MYEPDLVVLYNGWNDINNFHAWEISPHTPLARVFTVFNPNANPYRAYAGSWDRWLSNSQLYIRIRNLYLRSTISAGDEGLLPNGAVASEYGSFGPRQYKFNLRNFVSMVNNMGAMPILATQATPVTSSAIEDEAKIAYDIQLLDHAALREAFEDVHQITRTVAVKTGTPLLDAASVVTESDYFLDHVHLSPSGSEAMAYLLADSLATLLGKPTIASH